MVRGGVGKRHFLILPKGKIERKEKGVLIKQKGCRPWTANRKKRC